MIHNLKINEFALQAKLNTDKLFEVRLNDRGYQKGDTVIYTEQLVGTKQIKHSFVIVYVTSYMQKENYVVFGEKYLRSE